MRGPTRFAITFAVALAASAAAGCDEAADHPVTAASPPATPASPAVPAADRAGPSSYSGSPAAVDVNTYRTTSAGSPDANPATQPGRFAAPTATPAKNLPPSGGDSTPPNNKSP